MKLDYWFPKTRTHIGLFLKSVLPSSCGSSPNFWMCHEAETTEPTGFFMREEIL
jgi:hypothetical protein